MDTPKNAPGMPPRQNEQPSQRERDNRGTKIDQVPGPKDAGKGAAGDVAKDRMDRKR